MGTDEARARVAASEKFFNWGAYFALRLPLSFEVSPNIFCLFVWLFVCVCLSRPHLVWEKMMNDFSYLSFSASSYNYVGDKNKYKREDDEK